MKLRRWQQKVIDEFPEIIKTYRKFILKAPTGAGKTVLASEIINRFYKNKKIVVLCHRLVLLEQLERGLSSDHKVKKLGLSELGKPFKDYDVLISTNLRSRELTISIYPHKELPIFNISLIASFAWMLPTIPAKVLRIPSVSQFNNSSDG